ncbi:hypothetical protein MBOU_44810 [Mycobacterium bourgelatii]|uniref:Uncharacterized protein n=1 Tax=Mycobacterium bourgelatii TaxID=1273442 RepID=A0A7I9YUS1_MYCBU|nr:hypothetical protein MBOU_44810 [Mycobacterium bourgelatii]
MDTANRTSELRLPAINAGCTTIDRADSNADTTTRACDAASSAAIPAALNHAAYGEAAAAIAPDAGPCQAPLTKPEVTDSKNDDAELNSAARPSHADATAVIGAEPAPSSKFRELISGGKVRKLTGSILFLTLQESFLGVVAATEQRSAVQGG